MVGRTWNVASSGCCGAGCDAGTCNSNSSYCTGSCTNDPRSKLTLRGSAPVGGSEVGGLAMFCGYESRESRNNHRYEWKRHQSTHKFELGLSSLSDADGLNTLFTRGFVIEPKECLMWLHTLSAFLLGYLKRELQYIRRIKGKLRQCFGTERQSKSQYKLATLNVDCYFTEMRTILREAELRLRKIWRNEGKLGSKTKHTPQTLQGAHEHRKREDPLICIWTSSQSRGLDEGWRNGYIWNSDTSLELKLNTETRLSATFLYP